MTPFVDNPFAILTTVVAPAVLTNACSVLALGTSNRIARVVDRSRVVATMLGSLSEDNPDRHRWAEQLDTLRHRARHLFWALRVLYAALGAFAASALLAVLGSASTMFESEWIYRLTAGLGLAVGSIGIGGLLVGCGLMVHEVRLALKHISEETDPALDRASIL